MPDQFLEIKQLLIKLETLKKRQDQFSQEIDELHQIINRLIHSEEEKPEKEDIPVVTTLTDVASEVLQPQITPQFASYEFPKQPTPKPKVAPIAKSDIEKYIGENLINKIGIAIIVIGVGIGAKYSIDHDLISPLMRILLGYLTGLGLLGFGIKLKQNYNNYSAALVSGAIAIFYFITYTAYSFYQLIPQSVTFAMMVAFTTFGVVAAINYNKQVIAHIGLVGAYAVPFLLSNNSGNVAILFSYMAIINIGILIIGFLKYWKSLYYSAFAFTWLIFLSWCEMSYNAKLHFNLSLIFLSIFFATFYSVFLGYKLMRKEKYDTGDILLLLANSFIFYGSGYFILKSIEGGDQFLGLFTLVNAMIHFGVTVVIYKHKLADRDLFYMVAGLVLTFITIAIPVQLDGSWVTMIWACEAALLFWIGRTKGVSVYETLSYPLMALSFMSITMDWIVLYNQYSPDKPTTRLLPLLNMAFLTSVVFVANFTFINFINVSKKHLVSNNKTLISLASIAIPAVLLISIYFALQLEITNYWNQLFLDSEIRILKAGQTEPEIFRNYDLLKFQTVWVINYSLLFLSILSFVNIKKTQNIKLGLVNLPLSVFCILAFLTQGISELSALCDSYVHPSQVEIYPHTFANIGIRYISFALVGVLLLSIYRYTKENFIRQMELKLTLAFDLLLNVSILVIASSELINWMEILNNTQSNKLGLSILWGVYSLILIAFGIRKRKKHLRIGAIALFGGTLVKLFFYDIADLDTIAKTVVFVSLGLLLLIISFLYNKFRDHISVENEN